MMSAHEEQDSCRRSRRDTSAYPGLAPGRRKGRRTLTIAPTHDASRKSSLRPGHFFRHPGPRGARLRFGDFAALRSDGRSCDAVRRLDRRQGDGGLRSSRVAKAIVGPMGFRRIVGSATRRALLISSWRRRSDPGSGQRNRPPAATVWSPVLTKRLMLAFGRCRPTSRRGQDGKLRSETAIVKAG